LEATKLEHKRLELRVKEKSAELERLKSQMTHIKTNKEYDALSREIDGAKDDISTAEDGILEALEAMERLTGEIEEKSAGLEEIRKVNGEQLANIKTEMDSVGDKIKIKQGERQDILVRLDPPWSLSTNECAVARVQAPLSRCAIVLAAAASRHCRRN
jgi:predicted  nucleic acid-binding Zn-ribbon protein